jgi:superfamily II DNA or RNA helicase
VLGQGLAALALITGDELDQIRIKIGSVIGIDVKALPDACYHEIAKNFTIDNPDYIRRKKFKRSLRNVPEHIVLYRHHKNWIEVPRGSLSRVRKLLKQYNLSPIFLTNSVVTESRGFHPIDDFNVTLRPYQKQALDRMHKCVQGVVQMPCGAGKTELGCAAVLTTGESAVILVHTDDIYQQWRSRVHRMSGTAPRVVSGTAKSDLSPLMPGEVSVCMIQTLISAGELAFPLIKSAGVVLTDECHHIPARTWSKLMNEFPARFRWGLTATPERSDGLGILIESMIGNLLYKIDTKSLIKDNYLMSPKIIPVWTGWQAPEDCYPSKAKCPGCNKWIKCVESQHIDEQVYCNRCNHSLPYSSQFETGNLNYSKAVTEMSNDSSRISMIVELVKAATNHNRTVLVLTPRKSSVNKLVARLNWQGVSVVGVTSDFKKSERKKMIEDVRNGQVSVLVATQLADEGLDLPVLDCAINTSAGRSAGTAKQRVGRTLRLAGMQPLVFELVDAGEFEAQWRARSRAYRIEYGDCVHSRDPMELADALEVLDIVDKGGRRIGPHPVCSG